MIESNAPAAPSKSKAAKAPVIDFPVSVMRTRKRDEKKEQKAPSPPPAPAAVANKK